MYLEDIISMHVAVWIYSCQIFSTLSPFHCLYPPQQHPRIITATVNPRKTEECIHYSFTHIFLRTNWQISSVYWNENWKCKWVYYWLMMQRPVQTGTPALQALFDGESVVSSTSSAYEPDVIGSTYGKAQLRKKRQTVQPNRLSALLNIIPTSCICPER